ncbi:MAG TPA: alpha-amylase family glycosyl hydrolase [Elusimicrobiales bacterium]|nr:alpha-amylase family glycosyl hydrolase [Elusimicrobiales bacterium]
MKTAATLLLLLVAPALPGSASDFRDETIYLVLTDRFADGDPSNNDIYGDEYVPGNLRYYQGGDFRGLMDNLSHIKDMGFSAVWITPPVMQPPGRYLNSSETYDAAGYHGYWAWDLSRIDPHLESKGASYADLIRKSHSRGLKLIQDVVANHGHGGDTHPSVKWHAERGKVRGLGLEFDYYADGKDWFNRRGPVIADLLDFNDENPATAKWLTDIYLAYQAMGVDAFRLDTVVWMGDAFWRDFTDALHAAKKDFFIFGEAWTRDDFDMLARYSRLSEGEPMNSAMSLLDMPLSAMGTWGPMEEVFKGGDYSKADAIFAHDHKYKDPTWLVTFLDNHDKPRFNGAGGEGQGTPASEEQYFDALNFYFTARGIPCVFYGTEVRMAGGNDPDNRRMLGAEGIKSAKTDPVYHHLKKLNAMRRSAAPLRRGTQTAVSSSSDSYVFRRDYGGETAVVMLNKGSSPALLRAGGLPSGKYRELYAGDRARVAAGSLEAEVPAHGLRVFVKGRVKGRPWRLPGGPEYQGTLFSSLVFDPSATPIRPPAQRKLKN